MSSHLKPELHHSKLSEQLRKHVLPLWQRQLAHTFVVALGEGSLPKANFQFYICQDALFLDVLAKAFTYAVTKSSNHQEMEQLSKYGMDALFVEAELHRGYGKRFGLTPAEMAAIPMAPTNYAYTRHLLSIATTGTLPEILTAVLPCAWIYADIGRHLVPSGVPPTNHPYADWLATYATPDFDAVQLWIREQLDAHTIDIRPAESAHLHEIFLISTRYEYLFWDMAWKLEEWPS